MTTVTERSQLAQIAYDGNLQRGESIGNWQVLKSRKSDSGLIITALIDEPSKRIEFIVAGTNDIADIPPDVGFLSGGYHAQFRESIEFVNDYIDQYEGFTFGTTGHSLGGGISQVLSYTFGIEGATFDAPPAWKIKESEAYQAHIKELGIEPKGVPTGFTNYTENVSYVSFVGEYLGVEVEMDLVPNLQSYLADVLLALGTRHPIGLLVGTVLSVSDQFVGDDSQHSKSKYPDYFSSKPDPDSLRDYR